MKAIGGLDHVDLSHLPAVAQDLALVIGLRNTMRLVEAFGGTTFPVPKRETKLGELRFATLASVIGAEAAEALVRRYGGTDLYFPRCVDALRRLRDASIIREYEEITKTASGNEAVQRLARQHQLSDRHIFNILKRVPESEVQVGGAVQLKLLES